ncbi:multidrug effflux MFS transporter [Herbaspirillum sp. NPDC087042]|uniref:multidrug effflux MFS transporter n=1 Tax=Herbaspirillum sp. NPDC087042 TaxID=3364004 RepID=UPI00381E3C64
MLILSGLMAFASISTDLYLPAMPTMGIALGAAHGSMEWTISGYLIGFSLGQLLWGPLGDRYGRRLPIAAGLVLFIIGSAGCALSPDVKTLIAWRILQAAGACASVVLARAMVRDLYSGSQAAKTMSSLMTVMAIAPLIGPSVGGMILQTGSWRTIFWILVIVGFATLLSLWLLPETLPPERRNPVAVDKAFSTYTQLLRDRRLLAYIGCGGFFYGGMYAYVSGTPSAYISYYHVSPQAYGLLFALGIIGIMATNQFNSRLVVHFGSDRLMRWGSISAAISGILLLIAAHWKIGGLAGLVLLLFLYVATTGFIVANAIAGALNVSPMHAGALSALIGATQYGTGIAGSALVGALANGTPVPMACIIALCGLGCAASALLA